MKIIVSRGTAPRTEDGRRLCPKCVRQPLEPWQKYCRPCKADYERDRRAGTVQMQLTPEERDIVLALRAGRKTLTAAGR